jgi:hypothetical protein
MVSRNFISKFFHYPLILKTLIGLQILNFHHDFSSDEVTDR